MPLLIRYHCLGTKRHFQDVEMSISCIWINIFKWPNRCHKTGMNGVVIIILFVVRIGKNRSDQGPKWPLNKRIFNMPKWTHVLLHFRFFFKEAWFYLRIHFAWFVPTWLLYLRWGRSWTRMWIYGLFCLLSNWLNPTNLQMKCNKKC